MRDWCSDLCSSDLTADVQRRHLQAVDGPCQSVGLDHGGTGLVGRTELALHERRVPVPVPAPVLVLAQVLGQAAEVLRSGPVRVVGGDGVGRLLQAGEPGEVARHEVADARSEEHTSELQSPMRISSAVSSLKQKNSIKSMHDGHSRKIPDMKI